MKTKFGFDKMLKSMERLKHDLPVQVGNIATRFFVDSFNKEGWTDQGFEKWAVPERRIPGTDAYKYPKKKDFARRTRKTLIGKSGGTKSGAHTHLKQSVNTSLKKSTWQEILFSVPQPYAQRHNEGLNMPKRQFMGNSKTLIAIMKQKIDKEMKFVMMRK